jgi:germination protein M
MERTIRGLLALTLAALAVAGCTPAPSTSAPAGPGSKTTTLSALPATPSVSPTSTAPTGQPVGITVYLDLHGKLQAVQRYAPTGTTEVLGAAIEALLEGPAKTEKVAGLATRIPSGTTLVSVRTLGNVATINLSSKFSSGATAKAMTERVAQIVYTSTQFPSIFGVKVLLNGRPARVVTAKGTVTTDIPQMRADYESVLPAIFVDSPAWGGTLREGDTIRGTANVFEAAFKLQLRDSKKLLLFDTTVRASSGTGTRGDWAAKGTLNGSGAKGGTLRVFDASAKDGKPENVIDIPVLFGR